MSGRRSALGILAATAVIAVWLATQAGVEGPGALPELATTWAVAGAFFVLCGYGAARLLLPADLLPRLWLYAGPVGVATGTLALTLLGILGLPFDVALVVVGIGAVALAVVAVRRGPEVPPPPDRIAQLAVPLALCVLVAAVACLPAFRSGFPAVQGQNGDAAIAVGTADFLQHAKPGTIEPELGLDRVHPFWRSKLPIYYGLAAVSRLSGQEPVEAFTGTAAVVLAFAALGFMLFVLDGLRAPPLAALAALPIVALDRMVLFSVYGPYFNQLWALFALPFTLLFGWRFLQKPDRRAAGIAGLFLALALFTYPLLLPFPVVFGAVIAWRRRRERGWLRALRLPAPKSAGVRYGLLALLAIPVALVLVRGVLEKAVPGLVALAPGGDLEPWSADPQYLPFYPFGWFFGVSMAAIPAGLITAAILLAAIYGVHRRRSDGSIALAVLITGGLLGGAWLLIRDGGQLFYFKDISFTGALAVMAAVVGLASLRHRGVAVAALVAFALIAADGARDTAVRTYEQAPRFLLELAEWDKELPVGQSIRLDVPATGYQLWSWYLMPRHRLSVSEPLGGFFPHPPVGSKADLVLTYERESRPPDAIGEPLLQNQVFRVYRLDPDLPGTDISTQTLVFDL